MTWSFGRDLERAAAFIPVGEYEPESLRRLLLRGLNGRYSRDTTASTASACLGVMLRVLKQEF